MLHHHSTRHRVCRWLLTLPLALSTVGLLTATAPAVERLPSFAKGQPRAVTELPPGQLRQTLEKLPPAARTRALKHLQGFSFPGNDVANLHADPRGDIFYADPIVEGAGTESAEPLAAEAFSLTTQNVFTLHSKPGATRVVYLDLDGHTVSGTAWNSSAGADPLFMLPFDTDSDPSSFSASELAAIAEIWKRVSEDLAPFDIDVTTQQPAAFGPNVGHILVSPVFDANGRPIYSDGYGGVAYVNVWGRSNFPYYQPALVFPDNLGYSPHNVAEAASHELGHNLGLSHDGTSTKGYYSGHGSGMTSWAPIMGVGYYSQVTQWSKGEYPDANNGQDDLAIISGMLTSRSDDHEDLDAFKATPLVRSGETVIASTTPVTDPDNLSPGNKGIIEDQGDIDLFYIDVAAGTINLTVTPAWREAFATSSKRGTNLDLYITLMDEHGGYITHANPADETSATVTATVAAGRYLLAVEGTGFGNPAVDGYSPYGSISQYFINGTVPGEVTTTLPPQAPGDLTASLTGANTIALSWNDPLSTPESNESSYRIFRQKNAGTEQLVATLPKDSTSYNDNNLASGSYVYFLEAFNSAGASFSNATPPLVVDVPSTAIATGEQTLVGLLVAGSYASTVEETGFERLSEAHQGGKPATRVSRLEHIWTITGVEAGAKVTLQLIAEAAANSENDDFRFTYSVDNGATYQPLGTVANGSGRHTLSVALPPDTQGTVLVRVTDTDAIGGNSAADTLDVHYLVIVSEGDPTWKPPTVSILIEGGPPYTLDTEVTLIGTANDTDNVSISESIRWNSSVVGAIGSGASVVYKPGSSGTHVITATATDSAGLTGQSTASITVNAPDNGPSSLAVSNLTKEVSTTKSKWNAMVTVFVTDNLNNPVDDATVNGTWSGATNGSGACTTTAGQCTVSVFNLSRTALSVTFSINDVQHATLAYTPTANSTITVNKP